MSSAAGLTTPIAAPQKTAFKVLAAISFCHMLNDMVQSLLPALYPVLKESFHLSFGDIGLLIQRLAVVFDGVLEQAGFLEQQAGVVEQLRTALAKVDQLRLQVERLLEILALNGQNRQTTQRIDDDAGDHVALVLRVDEMVTFVRVDDELRCKPAGDGTRPSEGIVA